MIRFYHTPRVLRWLYAAHAIWQMPGQDKTIYLTFDDGPTPDITRWILDVLDGYGAKATFFCVGDNVRKHPEVYQEILRRRHQVGNHSFNHLNGWQTSTAAYLENVSKASGIIKSHLFRPPYGRIKPSQAKALQKVGYNIVLWSVLTYDFDKDLDRKQAWQSIINHTEPGSILVFHDHAKAFENLKELLPKTLEHFSRLGYAFAKIEQSA